MKMKTQTNRTAGNSPAPSFIGATIPIYGFITDPYGVTIRKQIGTTSIIVKHN